MIDKVKVNGELIEVPKNFEKFKCKEMMEPFEHPAIILIGPRRSGKTTALKHFLYENRNW